MSLLVFLHGLGQLTTVWQDQVTAMPSGVQAVAPWITGLKPGDDSAFDLARAADDVLGQLNVFGVEEMAICGVGLGASVALEAAIRSPECVSHLVLAAPPSAPASKLARKAQLLALKAAPRSRFAAAGLDKAKAVAIFQQLLSIDLRGQLGGVSAKTLVVVGDRPGVDQKLATDWIAELPNARLLILPGTGVSPNTEAPAAFNEALYDFITTGD